MQPIDALGEAAPPTLAPRGSQSRLSPAIFFVLLAALLFRVVSAVMDRPPAPSAREGHGPPPLVRWVPLDKATSVSAASGKPVLYDFTAEWCPPCHRLDDEGWGDAELAGLASQKYVSSRVMDREREDGKNSPLVEELQRRYKVDGFPTLVLARADGREIARLEGWAGREELRTFLTAPKGKTP